jgi:sugar O-acyltransferase (sialic acid O-acetyltransferase NeuD family)
MSEARKIILWGGGGHALVVADILRCQGGWEIVGFLDDADADRRGEAFGGATILGGREQLARLREQGVGHAIVAFGDCAARLELADVVRRHGFELATAVHPRSTVARDVSIGAGTVIAAGAILNPAARLGENVIINTAASVDHECVIEDGAHVSPGAHLGGRVRVGRAAWIGIGASVVPRITIGAGSIIGAGAVVIEDVPPGVVAYGVPARVRRGVEDRKA